MRNKWAVVVLGAFLLIAGCSEPRSEPKKSEPAPNVYQVKFETSKGDFIVEVDRDWAPMGADRFHELTKAKFFDDSRFFRVLRGFVVQFGLNGDPDVNARWRNLNLVDDPVKQPNSRGTITFATSGPGTRTTQVFINLADNSKMLDRQGFSPFGKVVDGMDIVDKMYGGYHDGPPRDSGPDQAKVEAQGNQYLEQHYPKLDYIKTARIIQPAGVTK
jgi:peptidyl-prolyl cis-trans isomerase A (cyclophilin A)